jgi:hypothetical protein
LIKQLIRIISAAAGLALFLFGCLAVQAEPAGRPDFNGFWELDFENSEHPNDKLRYLYEVTLSHYQRQVNNNDPQFRDSAIRAMDELRGIVNLGRLAELITRTTVLEINQDANHILVDREDNFSLACEFANTEITGDALGRERCGWRNNQLIFDIRLPEGLAIQHRIVKSADGRRLNISTTLASDGVSQAFSVNRVFIPFQRGKGAFECKYILGKGKVCSIGGDS